MDSNSQGTSVSLGWIAAIRIAGSETPNAEILRGFAKELPYRS